MRTRSTGKFKVPSSKFKVRRKHFALCTSHFALLFAGGCSVDETLALDAPAVVAERGGSSPSIAPDPRSGGSLVAWVETDAGGESNV